MKKIRLLIIEDNRLLREGITALIKEQPDLMAVGSLGTRENILKKITQLKLDVILLDMGLPQQNSLQLVKRINKDFPKLKIIVMDLIPSQSDILNFVQAGVLGFILKDASVGDFLKTIRSVARGTKVLPPHLTGSLFTQIVEHAINGSKKPKISDSVRMTKREKQIIELIADGLSNKEIAQQLHLSVYTIKSHVHNILEKLALHTRVQIAKYSHVSDNVKTAADDITLLDD